MAKNSSKRQGYTNLKSNMKQSEIDIITRTIDDFPIGVGIFQVQDLNDITSIKYVFMNKVFLNEMRKDREEVFGKKIMDVAPEAFEHEGGRLVMETYRKVAKEGGSVNLGLVEYSNHLVAGTYECSVHHIKENYVYVMLRNITELEQIKNKLELKNNELGQFAHTVSHDLKAPLHTISGFVQIIENHFQGLLNTEAQELLSYISRATERMTGLITDLLNHSSIGQRKQLSLVDCRELVQVVKEDLAIKIKETNATFNIGTLPKVEGFETELRMLFQNLIMNAIKFHHPETPPKISIHAKEQENCWKFYIKDNGIGIPDEHMDKIFGVFQRLHSNDKYEGTGIGLAHCKKIVDLHQGDIGANSTVGNGSTFYFTIPN